MTSNVNKFNIKAVESAGSRHIRNMKLTTDLVVLLIVIFSVFALQSPINANPHRAKQRKRFPEVGRRYHGCGSRFVDKIRFLCQMETWKENTCLQTARIFCSAHPLTSHPLCRMNCGQTTRNDDSSSKKFRQQINRQRRHPRNRSKLKKSRLSSRRTRRKKTSLSHDDTQRRSQQSLVMKCCTRSCSTSDMYMICHGGNI